MKKSDRVPSQVLHEFYNPNGISTGHNFEQKIMLFQV